MLESKLKKLGLMRNIYLYSFDENANQAIIHCDISKLIHDFLLYIPIKLYY